MFPSKFYCFWGLNSRSKCIATIYISLPAKFFLNFSLPQKGLATPAMQNRRLFNLKELAQSKSSSWKYGMQYKSNKSW